MRIRPVLTTETEALAMFESAAPALREGRPFPSDTRPVEPRRFGVSSETGRLTDVMLGSPAYLEAVPCCSVTAANIRDGFQACRETARRQHEGLRTALSAAGVRCHFVPAVAGMPDMAFVRDAVTMTPWGLMRLAPAEPHRRAEAGHIARFARHLGVPLLTPEFGDATAEGGDIAVIRPGLLAIGISEDRTNEAGAAIVARPFEEAGWQVIHCRFDPHFLHLDTQFCMLDRSTALACRDVLSDAFLTDIDALGIRTLPVTYKEVQALGGNVVSLGDRRILSTAHNGRVNAMLADEGFDVIAVDLDQFTRCGGGPHCLTMPLRRL